MSVSVTSVECTRCAKWDVNNNNNHKQTISNGYFFVYDICISWTDHSVVERCVAEPRWASVNRGVLICDECCSIHRGLGRHSSQVRHLTHTPWPPSQLQVMCMSYDTNLQSTHHVTQISSRQLNNDHAKRHTAEYIRLWLLLLVYDL